MAVQPKPQFCTVSPKSPFIAGSLVAYYRYILQNAVDFHF